MPRHQRVDQHADLGGGVGGVVTLPVRLPTLSRPNTMGLRTSSSATDGPID